MAHFGNKDLAHWFADPASKEYWFHIRIVGSILELHAEHLSSEHRYVSRARRMEEAAPELLRLIRTYPPVAPAVHDDDDATKPAEQGPTSVVTRAWRQASKVVTQMYYAVAG